MNNYDHKKVPIKTVSLSIVSIFSVERVFRLEDTLKNVNPVTE